MPRAGGIRGETEAVVTGKSRRRGRQPSAPVASRRTKKQRADSIDDTEKGARSDWSALPALPLNSIAQRLTTLMDFLSFRGVCAWWRTIGKAVERDVMASHPPLLFRCSADLFYHLTENRVYKKEAATDANASIAGFWHGYLILKNRRVLWLMHPLTGAEKRCFPRAGRCFHRAILSSPPTSPGCVLVGHDSHNIQYCRPRDKKWTVVYRARDNCRMGKPAYHLYDVSVVGEKGYALLDKRGSLAIFDFTGRPELTIINVERTIPQPMETTVLLDQCRGELLQLHRLPRDYTVFKFDSEGCKWVRLENLHGLAMFMNQLRGSVFVEDCAKWGGRKDCIYYENPFGEVVEYRMGGTPKFSLAPWQAPADQVGFSGVWVLPSLS